MNNRKNIETSRPLSLFPFEKNFFKSRQHQRDFKRKNKFTFANKSCLFINNNFTFSKEQFVLTMAKLYKLTLYQILGSVLEGV